MKSGCTLRELFFTFFKIGLFTFGGGYAMIGVIESICVEKKKWLSHDEMANIAVVAESTPGPIAINSATYVGNTLGGFWGAVCATMGVVLPSFVIIFLVSMGLDKILTVPVVANAFAGIKVGVSLLILDAGINMAIKGDKSMMTRIILAAACVAMLLINIFAINISSVALMIASAVLGGGIYAVRRRSRDDFS